MYVYGFKRSRGRIGYGSKNRACFAEVEAWEARVEARRVAVTDIAQEIRLHDAARKELLIQLRIIKP